MSKPLRRGRLIAALACLAVLGVAVTTGAMAFFVGETPRATWRFGAELQTVGPFDEVSASDPMVLEVSLPFQAWVYLVCFNVARGCRAMFPSDYLATNLQNPLPAGTHRLPGQTDGKELAWAVPECSGEVASYILVVSTTPLPDLHKRMRVFLQIGNTAFADRSFGVYLPRGGKNVLPRQNKITHPILKQAAFDHEAAIDGPMLEMKDRPGVFIKAMHVIPKERRRG